MIKKAPLLLLLILLIPFAYSDTCDPAYLSSVLISYWDFQENGKPYEDDVGGQDFGQSTADPTRVAGTGNFSYAQDFDGSDRIYRAAGTYLHKDVFTLCFWFRHDTIDSSNRGMAGYQSSTTGGGWMIYHHKNDGAVVFDVWDGSANRDGSYNSGSLSAGSWYHVCNVWDGDDAYTYIDGTTSTHYSNAHDQIEYEATEALNIGTVEYGIWTVSDTTYSHVSYFNAALNNSCRNYVESNVYPFSVAETPLEVTHISPVNNTINNTDLQVIYNVTITANCSFHVNGSLEDIDFNVEANTSLTLNFTPIIDGVYTYVINCSNDDELASTAYYEWEYDSTAPFISWVFPLNDNSSLVAYQGDANINLSATDDNLYAGNFTVYKPDDSIYYNDQTVDINTTTWAYNLTILNITDSGEWDVRAQFWDSHTTTEFKVRDVIIDIDKQEWLFITEKDDTISLSIVESSIKNNVVSIYTDWEYDRYTFRISADKDIKKGDYIVFNINTNKPLKYLKNSKYVGHFIIGFDYWIDFEGIPNTEVTYLGNNQVRVLFNDEVDKDKIIFKSIGGLNYNEEWAHFTVLSPPSPPSNSSVSCEVCLNSTINCTVIYAVNSSGWLQQQIFCENYLNSTVQLYGITREVNKTMILAILILLPIIAGFALLYGASQMGEAHTPLKIFMYLLTPVMFWASMHIGLVSVIYYFNFPTMQETLATYTQITGWIFGILIAYWAIYFIYVAFQAHEEKKKERLEY